MRAKRRRSARGRPEARRAAMSTTQWLLHAEVGWGMPHWLLALPGLAMLGLAAIPTAIARWQALWRRLWSP